MGTLSSGHFSLDQQAEDAMLYLETNHHEAFTRVLDTMPEYSDKRMSGSWWDVEAMGVDGEWGSWLVDAIEETGLVMWHDGEPWTADSFDDEDDD